MSKKVLVTLVSEQTIPNLLIPLEKGPFDKYIFITTKKVNDENIPNNIIETIKEMYPGSASSFIKSEEVNEKSIKDVWNKIDKEIKKIDEKDVEFTFNFTNGTKQMSIALYSYAKTKYLNSDLLYSNRDSLTYVNYKNDSEEEEKYTKFLTLSYCLTALGRKLSDKVNGAKRKTPHFNKDLAFKIYDIYTKTRFNNISDFIKDLRNKKHTVEVPEKYKAPVKDIFGFDLPDKLTERDNKRVYMIGGWLEDYTYFCLQDTNGQNKSSIEFIDEGKEIQEFDVLMVKNNKVYIFECKTAIAYDKIQNIPYKSSALVKKFGTEAVSFIVYPHNMKSNTLKILQERAKLEKIKTIPANRIKDFEIYLKEQQEKDKETKNKIENPSLRDTARIIKSK